MKTCLIASLGVAKYQTVEYAIESQACRTPFSPVAVARLRNLSGQAFVMATQAARKHNGPALQAELLDAGLETEWIEVAEGRSEGELLASADSLGASVPAGSTVVLDVTLGLRHLPFTYLAALAFLTGLRQVRVEGIWYGAFELKEAEVVPLIDVTALFRLLRWYQAVEAFSNLGDLRPVAGLLREAAKTHDSLKPASKTVSGLAAALACGLPLEVGLEAGRVEAALAASDDPPPLVKPVLDRLRQIVAPLAAKAAGKRDLRLDREEIDRQLKVIERFCQPDARGEDLGAPAAAMAATLTSLSEWIRNWLLWHEGAEGWLDREVRGRWERFLAGKKERADSLFAPAAALARLGACGDAAELLAKRAGKPRNDLAHAGMGAKPVHVAPGYCAGLVREARTLLANCPHGSAPTPASGAVPGSSRRTSPLLVTPLGLSPGVLFSAVCHIHPGTALVATSAQASPLAFEALAAAGRADLPHRCLVLADPFLGFTEARAWLGDATLDAELRGARQVVVNLTGGTTALQYAVERIAEHAAEQGVPVHRVAVIDRRTPEEQRQHPYVLGEIVDVD